ncbi:hypothetical protein TIFTF001_012132 [Ficus carica]|uniref:ATP-dependent RNA helicase n=1 Tax=Ficus carica TaxID=3494 RepID=A0AA87ZVG4_FICCA|nr:hypothetical protein TIFTF001_012132 [Ficus carica]
MPVKLLLQLRLLNPTLPATCFSPLKLGPSMSSSASFSRIFPSVPQRTLQNGRLGGTQRFSTRPSRSRSEFSRGGDGGEVRASKSLIDDEAELSDWVSELRSDSFLGGGESDRDRGGVRSGAGRVRVRDSDSAKRRRRESSDSEEFDDPNRRRLPTPAGSFPRNSQINRRSDTRNDDGADFSSRRRSSGVNSSIGKRGGRDMDSGYNRNRDGKGSAKDRKDSRKPFGLADGEDDGKDREAEKIGIVDLLSEEESDTDDEEGDEDFGNVLQKAKAKGGSLFGLEKEVNEKASTGKSESYLSETRFNEFPVSPLSLKGIKDAGYEKMTVVQEATLPVILKGKDVLARAKTGTGKTVAFLLPSIEVVVNSPPIDRDQKRPPILVLVICPTRELASQAAMEANILLKYHPSLGVQVVIGGTRLALEQKRMQANPCQILVATPGRLRDHMENTAGFATRLMGVKVLVLDEADQLLDMGFRKDIERIIAAVPKQRQTLLFSATVSEEVRQVCHIALKRDHEFINTVQQGSEDTHSQVRQMYLVAPLEKQFSQLYVLLKEHIADDVDYKVIVFCTTAMVTRLVAELLRELNINVREIHSRKSQSYRTKVSDEFRKSKGLILVTSDVSARGVDYPDVTFVVQVGLPADSKQYIHRLGRTGRKGKEGEGMLLLAPWEEFFLSSIKALPITKASEPSVDPDMKRKVERALSKVEMKTKEAAYQAWLGYYNSNKTVARDKYKLVELANEFSRCMGLDNPPAIPKLILGKMGLKNVPGLRSR